MSIQAALVAIKTANGTLNTLIGTKFHPDALPQGIELPAVRFQVIDRPGSQTMAERPRLTWPRVQVDGYAASSALRSLLRLALLGAFQRVNGTYGGEVIQDIRKVDERESLEMLDTQTQSFRISLDLIVDIVEV